MVDKEFVKERLDKIFDMIDNLHDDNRYEVMKELSDFKIELLQKMNTPRKTHHGGIFIG
jgi:hypothetical protein